MTKGRALAFSASSSALVFLISLPIAAIIPPMLILSMFGHQRFGMHGLTEWLSELGGEDASALRLVIVIVYAIFCLGFAIWSSVRAFFCFYTLLSPVKPRTRSE